MAIQKVLVAMSGGVDSSVAALLLQKQGCEVCGATFELFDGCNENNVEDAKKVCEQLGIPHMVFDYRALFSQAVMDYFVESYQRGETPNPCVACNRAIKFGVFAQDARRLGYSFISTGHYAGAFLDEKTGRWALRKSIHRKKDQSYVLYHLSQEQLSMLLLPVDPFSKDEVRAMAAEAGLCVTSKSDSQDICFVPGGDYVGFMERYLGKPSVPGDYLDDNGTVIGRHKGVWHYTIGQRKGLGVSFGCHRFVSSLDPVANTVTLSDENVVFSKVLYGGDLRLIAWDTLEEPVRCEVKIRYSHTPAPAVVEPLGDGCVRVTFDTPQRAVTAGQAAVFYRDDQVLGGVTIIGTTDKKEDNHKPPVL